MADTRVEESESELIAVTMTRGAAERFKRALIFCEGCTYSTLDDRPPITVRDQQAMEHAGWLRWGESRVTLALTGELVSKDS